MTPADTALPEDRRILVVEDEVHIREPLGLFLRQKGFEVDLAADGEAGLEQLVDGAYFLVISDISMPRMDGLELLRRIKEARPQTDVMMITGNMDEEFAITALKRGAYEYLRKPFDFQDLAHAVDRVVEKRRLEREADAYKRLLERTKAEQEFAVGTVKSLVVAVEAKDIYTRGHSERVGALAVAIGRLLKEDTETLERAGQIHDIGKIGIPEMILNKPTKLTEEEFDVIRQHPLIGEKIVSPTPVLRDLGPLIRHHHERHDGTGYPDGLAGDDIPIGARILSVADVADALSRDRAYRPGSDVETVVDYIRTHAGTQFDPEVAEAFIRLVEEEPQILA